MESSEYMARTEPQHWYVAYTLPRHEKAVAHRLGAHHIYSYVPLYSEVRKWRDRRVEVELPLFPSYVFIRMLRTDKGRIMAHPGIIRLLTENGNLAVFPDDEMSKLQAYLAKWKARPYPSLVSGKRVRVTSGPFSGVEGTILRRNGKKKLILTLDLINSSIVLELDSTNAQLAN